MYKLLTIVAFTVTVIIASLLIWTTASKSADVQAEAIRHAKEYHAPAGSLCTMAITPAIHIESGAKYTFSDGCIPSGWKTIKG